MLISEYYRQRQKSTEPRWFDELSPEERQEQLEAVAPLVTQFFGGGLPGTPREREPTWTQKQHEDLRRMGVEPGTAEWYLARAGQIRRNLERGIAELPKGLVSAPIQAARSLGIPIPAFTPAEAEELREIPGWKGKVAGYLAEMNVEPEAGIPPEMRRPKGVGERVLDIASLHPTIGLTRQLLTDREFGERVLEDPLGYLAEHPVETAIALGLAPHLGKTALRGARAAGKAAGLAHPDLAAERGTAVVRPAGVEPTIRRTFGIEEPVREPLAALREPPAGVAVPGEIAWPEGVAPPAPEAPRARGVAEVVGEEQAARDAARSQAGALAVDIQRGAIPASEANLKRAITAQVRAWRDVRVQPDEVPGFYHDLVRRLEDEHGLRTLAPRPRGVYRGTVEFQEVRIGASDVQHYPGIAEVERARANNQSPSRAAEAYVARNADALKQAGVDVEFRSLPDNRAFAYVRGPEGTARFDMLATAADSARGVLGLMKRVDQTLMRARAQRAGAGMIDIEQAQPGDVLLIRHRLDPRAPDTEYTIQRVNPKTIRVEGKKHPIPRFDAEGGPNPRIRGVRPSPERAPAQVRPIGTTTRPAATRADIEAAMAERGIPPPERTVEGGRRGAEAEAVAAEMRRMAAEAAEQARDEGEVYAAARWTVEVGGRARDVDPTPYLRDLGLEPGREPNQWLPRAEALMAPEPVPEIAARAAPVLEEPGAVEPGLPPQREPETAYQTLKRSRSWLRAFVSPVRDRLAKTEAGKEAARSLDNVITRTDGEFGSFAVHVGRPLADASIADLIKFQQIQDLNAPMALSSGAVARASEIARRVRDRIRGRMAEGGGEIILPDGTGFAWEDLRPDKPWFPRRHPATYETEAGGPLEGYSRFLERSDGVLPHGDVLAEAIGDPEVAALVLERTREVAQEPRYANMTPGQYWRTYRQGVGRVGERAGFEHARLHPDIPFYYGDPARLGFRFWKLMEEGEFNLRRMRKVRLDAARAARRAVELYRDETIRHYMEGVRDATGRVEMVREFGADFASGRAGRLAFEIEEQGGEGRLLNMAVEQAMRPPPYGTDAWNRMISGMSNIETVTKLSFFTTPLNLTQLGTIPLRTGFLDFLGGLRDVVAGDPEAWEFSVRCGAVAEATLDQVINKMIASQGAGFFRERVVGPYMEIIGFKWSERFMRAVAANAGRRAARHWSQRLLANPDDALARSVLRDNLGIDPEAVLRQGGLTYEMELVAGHTVPKETQFLSGMLDLPEWANFPGGRLMLQFKTFSYQQMIMLRNVLVQDFRRGIPYGMASVAKIAAYAGLPPYIVVQLRHSLYNAVTGEQWDRPGSLAYRIIDHVADMAGLAFVADAAKLATYEHPIQAYARMTMPPSAQTWGWEFPTAVQEAATGDVRQLGKFAVRRVPGVGSWALYPLYRRATGTERPAAVNPIFYEQLLGGTNGRYKRPEYEVPAYAGGGE